MRRIVFLDVDGTLVRDDQTISPATVQACRKARENGHKLFLCTGRSRAELFDNIVEIGFDGYICAGGGYAVADGQVLFHHKVSLKDVQHVVDFCNANEIDFYLESNGGLYASSNCVSHIMQALGLHNQSENPFTAAMRERQNLYREDVNKICFLQSDVSFERIAQEFADTFEVIRCTVPSFGADSGELAVRGVSKTYAIKRILNYLGVRREDTIAIGDGMNDIGMIAFCQVGIAMGNAVEALRSAADFVTDTVVEDGLAKAFVRCGLISVDDLSIQEERN
ncbi:Cof-type HAD-IIB family hydrolase [Agathobaculum sp. Marseille-P7918]|uniref:Cof-type HAD-IIB family hydrolase n=1 Tax=Agathobaculum sp. Marseille-P7918 TaxID=2479843 RepID=UPI003564DB3C